MKLKTSPRRDIPPSEKPPCAIAQPPGEPWWLREERIPISKPQRLGLDVNDRTLWRWYARGTISKRTKKRVKLAAVYIGQVLYTSVGRVNAFIMELNGLEVA